MTIDFQHSVIIAGAVGLLSGTHAAIWGMYKDAVHEGFGIHSFLRSIILGTIVAATLQTLLRLSLPSPMALVLLFGLAYAAERGIVEVWKTFVRQEEQSKYFIPMQFSVGGVPVASRGARLAAGAAYVAAVGGCLVAITRLQHTFGTLPFQIQAMLVGLIVGTVVAIGGCWKDAPKEGFDPLKFFRSPIVTVLCALVMSWMTENYLLIASAAMGFERATVETYKTFLAAKPPGKFLGKPILHPYMFQRRRRFVPAYVAISVAVFVSATIAVGESAIASSSAQAHEVVASIR